MDATAGTPPGFRPPVYPYERLAPLAARAAGLPGGLVDLSVGTPTDPPPPALVHALAAADGAGTVRGYPPSAGTDTLRRAAAAWIERRFGCPVDAAAVAACVGTKEFVATLPQWLKLRQPGRDTVLVPAVAYPTYRMGAVLAGLRVVAVPADKEFRLDLSAVGEDDARRALLVWANSPGNPCGQLEDLAEVVRFGRRYGVVVASDECYAEFTWTGEPRTVLAEGGQGVIALHSLSKRSNAAGLRVGWYAGDGDLIAYLREVRKHAGLMVPGPAQLAAAAALADDDHVEAQRGRYRRRLERLAQMFSALGSDAPLPDGGFYLWAPAPGGDEWEFTERLAVTGGLLVSPGEFYG
ncbi:MAG TPA: pyridoxal phosphate-dependent aminotransferase, partial [Acidimicrobiales bacterium]|nr:pyridoxal phosphate-dependent aminotransferase [Acidimicrobiales bacterium]